MHTRRLRLISVLSFLFLALAELIQAQTPLRLEPVSPCRLVDTRPQNGGSGPIGAGFTQNFNLPQLAELGKFCPAFSLSAAAAYSLNVTLVPVNGGPVAYLTIWPTGETQPVVSLMNSLDGRIKANAAIVPAGASGQVSVYVTNTTNVLLDINAYFDSASDDAALAFFPLTPCRVVDTRTGNGGPLQGGVERDFPMQGTCNIPATAKAYSLNLTVVPVNDAPVSYLTTWPFGSGRPVVSTLNDLTGTIVANAAVVPAGTSGEIAAYASTGAPRICWSTSTVTSRPPVPLFDPLVALSPHAVPHPQHAQNRRLIQWNSSGGYRGQPVRNTEPGAGICAECPAGRTGG